MKKNDYKEPYFKFDMLSAYGRKVNKTYSAKSDEAKWFYDTRNKLYYLVSLLSERLNEDFEIVYREKPNGQRGPGLIGFKDYILVGFTIKNLNVGDDLFMKIAISNLHKKPVMDINIDLNYRKKTSPFQKNRDEIFNAHYQDWALDKNFPDNWEDLLNMLEDPIRNLLIKYKQYLHTISIDNNLHFKGIIDKFKEALTHESSVLKDFTLGTYTDKSYYVKISDHKNVIGTSDVHYEIRSLKSGLAVELHFEGTDENKNRFKKIQLPPSLEWFPWMSANSIRHKGFISKEEKDIVPQLISKLEVMENQIGDQIRSIMENENNSQNGKSNIELNQILYGPPGTGKTYSTILEAAQIISKKEIKNYKKALEIFNSNLEDQIEFITFHQNYSYEDFIQGLRPDVEHTSLSFNRTDGIFTKIAVNALFEYYKLFQKKQREEIQNPKAIDINEAYLEFLNHLEVGQEFDTRTGEKVKITGFTDRQNIEFKPIKGNRPYLVSGNRLIKLYKKFPAIEKIQRVHEDIRSAIGGCNASIYYVALREFIEYLNDYEVDEDILGAAEDEGFNYEDIPYNRKKELLANTDLSDLRSIRSSEVPNYVIIIDEINRANISRVFGELITLIEKDKRSHGEIPLKVTLPSGEKFIVPSNLFIIGTMNTADKSIALLDIALRRRFEFVPMYPKYDIEDAIINENNLLQKINLEIISRKGHDFTIGHSYFMGIEFSLENTINNKVLPLMLEYFMNDYIEVKKILNNCGVLLNEEWPMKFAGLKND